MNSAWLPPEEPKPTDQSFSYIKSWMSRRSRAIAMVLLVSVGACTSYVWLWFAVLPEAAPDVFSLPIPSEVRNLTVSFWNFEDENIQRRHLEIPEEHFAEILNPLRDTKPEPTPPSFMVFGELVITCKNHKKINLQLYISPGEVIAFSIDPPDSRSDAQSIRRYFCIAPGNNVKSVIHQFGWRTIPERQAE